MKTILKISTSMLFLIVVSDSPGAAVGSGVDAPINQVQHALSKDATASVAAIHPAENFRSLLEVRNFSEAIQLFQKATMHYKTIIIYDFIKQPCDSPELDYALLEYLRAVSEIETRFDYGTESRAARNGASDKLLKYFGAKYGFVPPDLDVWGGVSQWGENQKIVKMIPVIEAALGRSLPPASSNPATQTPQPSLKIPSRAPVPVTAQETADAKNKSSPWWIVSVVAVGVVALLAGLNWLTGRRARRKDSPPSEV